MFDRTNSRPGDRSGDETFRKMLFGGRLRQSRPSAIPAMERLSPATEAPVPIRETPAPLPCLEACSLAMVYSPIQEWRNLYPINEALRKGTLFAELDKPFRGRTLTDR